MPNPDLRDEMKAPVEPLPPIEKKLIGWSSASASRCWSYWSCSTASLPSIRLGTQEG